VESFSYVPSYQGNLSFMRRGLNTQPYGPKEARRYGSKTCFFLLLMDSKREVRLKSARFGQASVLVRHMLLQSVMSTSCDKNTEEINTSKH
jgi:hypothetical protein